ncbi:DeoR family transcriptional regulator [Xaviernesmea oryzae]|uniref:DeoR family transcriptional regulator n=1 Tax=Xaviernesmea oryzae TaxID=464029 RepID=A0A1Q9AQM7_9HYPH|nr:DeoR/GlpR family DNA-binding transcription regulator [Xaviernesmea oryzae]OLP57708.1 DeoR family transcriptional regulator [Xaviernesmea oryzae]SEM05216.1 transcriptional regulator, DeoR family [Xaviernesmea oryzae]
MKREERKQAIVDLLIEKRVVDLDDLAERFFVSRMTVHRDLDDLEQAGLLRKVRGGATIEPGTRFESDFSIRELQETGAKRAIAKAALDEVEPGMSVMINDGSMAALLGTMLVEKRPLTVITNNAAVLEALKTARDITLMAPGGIYSAKFNAYLGLLAEEALAGLSADLAFISAPAVSGGVAYHMDEAVVRAKRAMMGAARRRCLLVNHRRFGRTALHRLAGVDAFEAVITDRTPPEDVAQALAEAGVALRVAPGEGTEAARMPG